MIKTASRLLAGALCAVTLAVPALAQSPSTGSGQAFPTRPIEVIVPYPAGGGTDVLARAFAEASRKHVAQSLIVVNKPGASGAIGWADVINGRPDGYKMVLLATDLMAQPNMGFTKITYEDFTPIARLNYDPAAVTVKADAPWNTLEEFLAAAKAPGSNIPYAGANPAALALMGGHIEAITVSATEVFNYVTTGKLKLLAVMSDTRIKGFEKVPTLKEKGIDVALGTWRGLAVAKATSPDVVTTLRTMTA